MNCENFCENIRRSGRANRAIKNGPGAEFIYQPMGFEPSQYPGPIADHTDAARWLLNTIYFKRIMRNYDPEEFVNLHSRLLGMVMGDINHVRPVREELERRGFIECDHEWALDRKSLGYRLGPKLSGSEWHRYYSPNKRFLKRIEKFKAWVNDPTGLTHPVHHHLADWVRRVRLRDDLESIFDEIGAKEKDAEHKRISKEELARHQADTIHRGLIKATVCSYGRFHSNYSGLCRELRPLLSIDGEPLVEIDVVNSQPYFLGLLLFEIALSSRNCPNLLKLLFHREEDHSLFLPSLPQKEEKEKKRKETTRIAPYVSGLEGAGEDLKRFIETTAAGRFYESLLVDGQWTRDELKPRVFEIIFGHRGVMKISELTEIFQRTFPTVFDMLLELKAEKGYKWVGQELQRRESNVVIMGVCNRLRVEHPSVPVVTVHDSLMTTPGHVQLVAELLREEFARFPVLPQFRIKENPPT